MKIFRIFPEFRILRLTFYKMLNYEEYINFFALLLVDLETISHFDLELLIFCKYTACFQI